jgi:hypothetical protein
VDSETDGTGAEPRAKEPPVRKIVANFALGPFGAQIHGEGGERRAERHRAHERRFWIATLRTAGTLNKITALAAVFTALSALGALIGIFFVYQQLAAAESSNKQQHVSFEVSNRAFLLSAE